MPNKSFLKFIAPVLLLLFVSTFFLAWTIPNYIKNNSEQEALLSAQSSVNQFKTLRSYYTKNVIKIILDNSDLKVSHDHKGKADTVPLPATMIHELSNLMEKDDVTIKLYSKYPFPNRASRQMDDFGEQAWEQIMAEPDQLFSRTEIIDDITNVRVAIADKMVAEACINCHNNHPDTPKNNWQMGDVRGVLEVNIPIENQLGMAQKLSMKLLSMQIVIILICIGLYFIYYRIFGARQKELLNEVNEQKTQLELVMKNTEVGLCDWHLITHKMTFNQRWAEILGYRIEELEIDNINEWLKDNAHPDDLSESTKLLIKYIKGKSDHFSRELRMRHKQGHWVWVLSSFKIIEWSDSGKPKRMIGTNLDYTERKLILEQLSKQKEYYETIINYFNFPAFIINTNHEVVIWNKSCESLTGLKANEVIGTDEHWRGFYDTKRACLADLVLDKNYQQMSELYEEFSENPSSPEGKRTQNLCHMPSGQDLYLDIDACPIFDEEGNIIAVIEVLRDITERKQVEEEIQKLSRALEFSSSMVAITNLQGNIDYINQRFTEITGYSKEEIIGKNINILNSEDTRQEVYADLWNTITSGKTWKKEYINRKKDGSLYWDNTAISCVKDENGDIINYICIQEDISKRKQAELELTEAKDDAEAATLAKSEFLANMSHEIRTPMNGILGMGQILMDTDLNQEQYDYVETIQSSGDALLCIINDILDFSKIESGKLDLEPIPFDLQVTMIEVVELLNTKCEQQNIELILHYEPNTPRQFLADPGRLRQVLLNLAGNAIKFTEQGHVLIEVECIQQNENEAEIRFAIEDTGIGISKEAQEKLFDSFSQADASTTRKYGGTGLGLTICKQLVELMGGKINVASTLDKGSTFSFNVNFPLNTETKIKPIPHIELSNMRALVVDDNKVNRQVLCTYLRNWNIQVESADSGQVALEKLNNAVTSNNPFHLALLDHQMPEMSGDQLCQLIKKNDSLKELQLALLSSASQRGDAKHFSEIGFSSYLVKPIYPDTLKNTLSMLWDRIQKNETEQPMLTRYSIEESIVNNEHVNDTKLNDNDVRRILLVEDNKVNQKVAKKLLEKNNCVVDIASNGQEGVDKQNQSSYDIVFMDCQMPVMDGFEATQSIREREKEKESEHHQVIIAMTANAIEGDRENCISKGMDDYLSKPINAKKLQAMLNKWNTLSVTHDDEDKTLKVYARN